VQEVRVDLVFVNGEGGGGGAAMSYVAAMAPLAAAD
jgi:hypothetical protein